MGKRATRGRLTKAESRARWAELSELVWQWDPIGVSDSDDWPKDEYDCVVGPLMRALERGDSEEAIADFLRSEIRDHFGLDPRHYDFPAVAHALHEWYVTNWSDTIV